MNRISYHLHRSGKTRPAPLSLDRIQAWLPSVPGWRLDPEGKRLFRAFDLGSESCSRLFGNWVAQWGAYEDHLPAIAVQGAYCIVSYTTRAVRGLSEQDFIDAVQLDELYKRRLSHRRMRLQWPNTEAASLPRAA